MADPWLPTRLRRFAVIVRGERVLEAAARTALGELADYCRKALESSSMDPAVLSSQHPEWQRIVDETLMPAVAGVFDAAFQSEARQPLTAAVAVNEYLPDGGYGSSVADLYAGKYLTGARNRMTGISDTMFHQITAALQEGRSAVYTLPDGTEVMRESIPLLSQRVDALLGDTDRWKNRATLVARTEVIGANNAGTRAAAAFNADVLGYGVDDVVKEWLATSDGRTRPTHADADGQQVLGLESPFVVGGYDLLQPGDPDGPADECCNCRCTANYYYPGDAGYPDDLDPVTAAGSTIRPTRSATLNAAAPRQETVMAENDTDDMPGVIIAALPAADDPVHGIGPEEKHATLLFFGTPDENPGLADEARSLLAEACATVAADFAPSEATVTGVESLGDDGARVWMLDPSAFGDLRAALLAVEGIEPLLNAVEQYPEFTPHVTIGYPEEGLTPEDEDAAAAVTEITFDRLAVWWGTSRSEFPLGGEAPEEEPMDAQIEAGVEEGDRALRLRVAGNTWAHIAEECGYPDITAAQTAADHALDRISGATEYAVPAPGEAPAGGPELAQDIPADGAPFYGIAWPEGVVSGDARAIDADATIWRDLPLSLMVQDATAEGHNGAVRVGRINTLERDTTSYAVPVIRYTGNWDTSEAAAEAARQVEAGVSRGVSVDGDRVTVELRASDGQALDPMTDEFPADGVVIEAATEARIAGATICSVPAFQQAYVANGTLADRTDPEPGWNEDGTPRDDVLVPGQPVEGVEVEEGEVAVAASAWTLVASAGAGPVVEARYFTNPNLQEPTPMTVEDDGHVYGHLATWGTCHIGIDGICQEPPVSLSNYAYYAKGVVHTDTGDRPHVGPLTMGTGHAPMHMNARAAAEHYDNTGTVVADVAIGQDAVGIWFSGKVRPGTTPEQVYAMRAAGAVSGDWREVVRYSGDLELVHALIVNVPGFAIPRPSVAASGDRATAMVASGIVRQEPAVDALPAYGLTPGAEGHRALVDALEANLALRARARSVQARVRGQRAATARRRFQSHRAAENAARVAAAAARLGRV